VLTVCQQLNRRCCCRLGNLPPLPCIHGSAACWLGVHCCCCFWEVPWQPHWRGGTPTPRLSGLGRTNTQHPNTNAALLHAPLKRAACGRLQGVASGLLLLLLLQLLVWQAARMCCVRRRRRAGDEAAAGRAMRADCWLLLLSPTQAGWRQGGAPTLSIQWLETRQGGVCGWSRC
jgi:hypothetical protein